MVPTHGIVCGDDTGRRIENDAAKEAWVLELVERIREAGKSVGVTIPVTSKPSQCAVNVAHGRVTDG